MIMLLGSLKCSARLIRRSLRSGTASIEREEALLEIRMREIQLMRAANAIYEKERFGK